jgi:hypothetical protein
LRWLFLAVAIAFAPALPAQSQLSDIPTPSQRNIPIYFVVDASGSMEGENKHDAELLLRALSLPRDQLVSVTYFGKKPATPGANLCFEALDVPDPAPRGSDFSPKLPVLGGKDDQTAVANALDSVLGNIKGPAKVILITDGQEGCNKNFGEVLTRHPDAEIEIRQVGSSPNAELQKLEGHQFAEPVAAQMAPPINVEFRVDTPADNSNSWKEADWIERFFWLVPYSLLAIAAWFFGRSYGNKTQFYENAIETLQNLRSAAAEHFARTNTRSLQPWPAFLSPSSAMTDDVRISRSASLGFFLLSCAAGIPLVFLSGAVDEAIVVTKVATPILILSLLYAGPRIWKGHAILELLPKTRNMKLSLAFGVIAISSAHFFMDGESARAAAWLVLGSGFSAALAIVASAPLLFAGTQLAKLDRAEKSYKSTWDHGIDETHREDMAEARKKEDERERLLSSFFGWMFPPTKTTKFRDRSFQKDKEAVRIYLGSLVRRIAEHAKKTNDNAALSKLHQTGDLIGSIRAVVGIVELSLPDQIRAALLQIADAYDSRIESRIPQAFSSAAKAIRTGAP